MIPSAFSCAASSLIRRPAFRFERPWRFLATQAYQQRLVASPPPFTHPPFISSNQPLLICNDPTSPNLYNITRDKYNLFHLQQINNVGFPDPYTTITAPGRHLVGLSQGFFISVSSSSPFDMRAINPVTGASLDLPPVSDDIDPKYVKVILSPSLDKAILLHRRPCRTNRVMAEFGFARLPASSWTPLTPHSMWHPLHNCIFHKGRLFMVDTYGDVAIFDDGFFDNPSASSPPLVWDSVLIFPQYAKRAPSDHILVESPDGDDLYLVFQFRDDYETFCFTVHKLDEHVDDDSERWKEVKSIGDLAVFVGNHHSVALRATNFPALEPDVIYFTTNLRKDQVRKGDDSGYDTGVYYLRSNCVHHFDVPGKHDQFLNNCPLMWFNPAAF